MKILWKTSWLSGILLRSETFPLGRHVYIVTTTVICSVSRDHVLREVPENELVRTVLLQRRCVHSDTVYAPCNWCPSDTTTDIHVATISATGILMCLLGEPLRTLVIQVQNQM